MNLIFSKKLGRKMGKLGKWKSCAQNSANVIHMYVYESKKRENNVLAITTQYKTELPDFRNTQRKNITRAVCI